MPVHMFAPLECFIGLRYLRARRRGVVSFITMASLAGIALGVAALIVILSVMNGLETELRTRLLSMTAHASISAPGEGLTDWRALERRLAKEPDVVGVAPYVSLEGMLGAGSNLSPVTVRGVVPADEKAVSSIAGFLRSGRLEDLQPGAGNIILGRALALNLGVRPGDRVNLLVPSVEGARLVPRLTSFLVSGLFEAGIQDNDVGLALIALRRASVLKGLNGRPEGLSVRLRDPLLVGKFRDRVLPSLSAQLHYSDWTVENRSYFRAIRIEKTMMAILLMLIVAVAAFNIVASLMMVVTDKRKDIAILRTYGLEPRRVARIFIVQGSIIGLAGTLIGLILGTVLALNVETIVPFLENTFGFQIMPGDVYYVTRLPSEVHLLDVTLIPLLAFLVAVLATLYPSRRAAAVAPAEALRYD
jgi:lipoprotein-releasing system permease protein